MHAPTIYALYLYQQKNACKIYIQYIKMLLTYILTSDSIHARSKDSRWLRVILSRAVNPAEGGLVLFWLLPLSLNKGNLFLDANPNFGS